MLRLRGLRSTEDNWRVEIHPRFWSLVFSGLVNSDALNTGSRQWKTVRDGGEGSKAEVPRFLSPSSH